MVSEPGRTRSMFTCVSTLMLPDDVSGDDTRQDRRQIPSIGLRCLLKEKHGKKTPSSTFHCNQLQHTCSACFKTDLPDYFRFNFVQVLTEPWCLVMTSRRSRDRNPGFTAADDAAARSVVCVFFIQINTFTYLRKMSIYQTNSVYVKLSLYSTM